MPTNSAAVQRSSAYDFGVVQTERDFPLLVMATKDTLKDLQQEVTCPLCLDTFEDPRVLSCQHTYCKSCLDSLISRTRGASLTITCPECRKPTDVPVGGVGKLPVAFKINRFKQLVSKMQLEETAVVVTDGPEESATPPHQGDPSCCKQHPNQALDVYCCECEEVVCRDCILFDKKHASHPYDKVGVAADQKRGDVAKKLAALLKKQPTVKKAAADVKNACRSVEESREVVCTKIAESYDQVLSVVEQKKQGQLQQFRTVTDARVKELVQYGTTLSKMSSEMSAVQSLVERGLKNLGNVEFMTRNKGMILKIDQMNSRINKLSLDQPEIELSPQVLDGKSVEDVDLLCNRFLRPYLIVDPLKCTAKPNSADSPVKVGEVAFASVSLKDSEGGVCHLQQCVTVELCCSRYGEKLDASVVMQRPSCYEATFTPNLRTRGHCQLVVQVNGKLIGSKPISVFIECPPRILGEPLHIINGIERPGCLRIVNDRMFCKTLRGVCILDLENTSKPPIQSGLFPRYEQSWRPSEMAIDGTFLFVSDSRNGKVHKFTVDCHFLTSTATNKDSLKRPNGLCVAPDGALYVCDSDNHCIHVFNPDFSLRLTFGSNGSAPGEFCWPDNIAFDSTGHFYVTDYRNHRIQCFTSNHEPKWCAGTQGDRPCDLNKPNVMDIFGSDIFVTDIGGVAVYDTCGHFVTRFAGMCADIESKHSPNGIIVDADGFVYVSDTYRNRIVVF